MKLDKDHLMVISPDEGGMGRAIYMANNLGVDMGMFYNAATTLPSLMDATRSLPMSFSVLMSKVRI